MVGLAVASLVLAAPALADDLNLPRERIDLVAPPFVQKHEQATRDGPKIYEVRLTVEEKEMVIDDEGTALIAFARGGRSIVAEVADLARDRRWEVAGLRVERGRLEDVFRQVTLAA